MIVSGAGYDVTRLAWVLRDLPVELVGRVRSGKAETQAWDRVHPRLTHRSSWLDRDGDLSLVEGTLMRLKVDHLPKERDAPPLWSWSSKTGATPDDVDRWTWILIVAHTQLRLAWPLAEDLRRPWEKPTTSDQLALGVTVSGSVPGTHSCKRCACNS